MAVHSCPSEIAAGPRGVSWGPAVAPQEAKPTEDGRHILRRAVPNTADHFFASWTFGPQYMYR